MKQSINNIGKSQIEIKENDKLIIKLDLKEIKFIKRGSNIHIDLDILNKICNELLSDEPVMMNE